jgi:hypothetical protein
MVRIGSSGYVELDLPKMGAEPAGGTAAGSLFRPMFVTLTVQRLNLEGLKVAVPFASQSSNRTNNV